MRWDAVGGALLHDNGHRRLPEAAACVGAYAMGWWSRIRPIALALVAPVAVAGEVGQTPWIIVVPSAAFPTFTG